MLKKLFSVRGLHFLITRFGPSRFQQESFDQKFLNKEWDFAQTPCPELTSVIERFANGGFVLMLGCGSASVVKELSPQTFSFLAGVDLSPVAISLARRLGVAKTRFEVGDMLHYRPEKPPDLIVFSESLYYINPLRRKSFLLRLAGTLAPNGHIIVTIAQPARYAKILALIRRHFEVVEDRPFINSIRHLIVFKPKR